MINDVLKVYRPLTDIFSLHPMPIRKRLALMVSEINIRQSSLVY